jgi:hypothetical protein
MVLYQSISVGAEEKLQRNQCAGVHMKGPIEGHSLLCSCSCREFFLARQLGSPFCCAGDVELD